MSVPVSHWIAIGTFMWYCWLPLHFLSMCWFIRRRKLHPISGRYHASLTTRDDCRFEHINDVVYMSIGRYPNITILMMCLQTLAFTWFGWQLSYPNRALLSPCWVAWTFFVVSNLSLNTPCIDILLILC
jgi:hypothetical protein